MSHLPIATTEDVPAAGTIVKLVGGHGRHYFVAEQEALFTRYAVDHARSLASGGWFPITSVKAHDDGQGARVYTLAVRGHEVVVVRAARKRRDV